MQPSKSTNLCAHCPHLKKCPYANLVPSLIKFYANANREFKECMPDCGYLKKEWSCSHKECPMTHLPDHLKKGICLICRALDRKKQDEAKKSKPRKHSKKLVKLFCIKPGNFIRVDPSTGELYEQGNEDQLVLHETYKAAGPAYKNENGDLVYFICGLCRPKLAERFIEYK